MKPNKEQVAQRISDVRTSLSLSISEFGKKLNNTPKGTVNSWLRALALPPTEKVKLIASLAHTSPEWILWGDMKDYVREYLTDKGHGMFLQEYPETVAKINNCLQERGFSNTNYPHYSSIDNLFRVIEAFDEVENLPQSKYVGKRIQLIRKELGLTMKEFGSKIDSKVKEGTVSNWENGKNIPNVKRLKKIAEVGEVSVEYLLSGDSTETRQQLLDIIGKQQQRITELEAVILCIKDAIANSSIS